MRAFYFLAAVTFCLVISFIPGMKKFPDLLPELGMTLEISPGMVTVWQGDVIVCLGVGKDTQDALRRAEPWFWQEMVDRKLDEIL